ncbi:MAG: hypothetical protein ABSF91_07150 [Bacteroidota bacterium]|jgi:opacity protein-like surface antigen
MKKIGLALLAVAVLATFAFAGDDVTPKTKSGDKAWMFTYNGLTAAGVGSYNGGAGVKYYFQDNMALRFGVSFSSSSVSGASNNPSSYGVTVGLEDVFSTLGSSAAYFGAQLMYGSSKNAATNWENASQFGIGVIAGVNWFPWNNVSLTPEYDLGFMSYGSYGNVPSSSSIGISSTGSLTISWFF